MLEIRVNLLSLGVLQKKGLIYEFSQKGIQILIRNKLIVTGSYQNKLLIFLALKKDEEIFLAKETPKI